MPCVSKLYLPELSILLLWRCKDMNFTAERKILKLRNKDFVNVVAVRGRLQQVVV